MNLIEAIKSGRPYRRLALSWRPAVDLGTSRHDSYGERLDDLLADDWEIQEPSVTVTRAQFWEAVESLHFTEKGVRDAVDVKALARRLGLGDSRD